MLVREARREDAGAMSAVLVDSITELCVADHSGRPEAIAEWTANKSPDSIRRWFDNADNCLLVAEDDGAIVGVGGYNRNGEVILNYVAPAARFRGVSKRLLAAIENGLRNEGVMEARLDSTETALRLYRAAGWRETGAAGGRFCHVRCRTMTKSLA